jgi:thiamine-phosphate pyrophosphorylase
VSAPAIGTRDTWSLATRRLYLCTADRPDLETFLAACISGGVDIVQLRDKVLSDPALVERARLAGKVCADHSVPFIINDRPDLVAETGADGVHVGQDDAPAGLGRRLLGPDAIVGLSTHSARDLEGALPEPVDYISAGPVEETPTKPGRPGTGLDYLALATERSAVPVFVTGGVTPERIAPLAAAGARHFVVVRYLTQSEHPADAARRLRQAIDEAVGS